MEETGPSPRRLASVAALVALAAAGCGGFGNHLLPELLDEAPTWEDWIRDLLERRCVRCHTSPPRNGAPTDFRFDKYSRSDPPDDLAGAFEQRQRILVRAVEQDTMPLTGPLPFGEQELLRVWIESGAARD